MAKPIINTIIEPNMDSETKGSLTPDVEFVFNPYIPFEPRPENNINSSQPISYSSPNIFNDFFYSIIPFL